MLNKIQNVKVIKMRKLTMFITAACVLFLIKLRWPKVKYFPWLKESARGNGLLSSSTVALHVPYPIAQVINQTMFHSQLERKKCHANMCLMLCLDVRETEFPSCTVKTIVLKTSCMNGFLRQKGQEFF